MLLICLLSLTFHLASVFRQFIERLALEKIIIKNLSVISNYLLTLKDARAAVMGKRKAEDDEWNSRKDKILKLYDTLPLSEVMETLANDGKNQYEGRLRKWRAQLSENTSDGIRGNITASEWKYIVKEIAKRQKQGKKSEVFKRGFQVPQSRIEKQGRVRSYQTALERFEPKTNTAVPSGIRVSTPQPQQALVPASIHNLNIPNLFDFRYTPWIRFVQKYNNFIRFMIVHGIIRKSPVQRENVPIHASAYSSLEGHDLLPTYNINPMEVNQITNLFGPSSTAASSGNHLPDYRALLPSHRDDDASSLAIRGTQLELLKYLVGLISNAHDDHVISEKIMDLAEDRRNLNYLSRFLVSKDFTVRAFREKLLFIALSEEDDGPIPNLDLIRVILDSGADVNSKNFRGNTPMRVALDIFDYGSCDSSCCLEIVHELVARGADWPERLTYPNSVLESLIERDAHITINLFLEWNRRAQTDYLAITTRTFVLTVHQGDIGVFQQLRHLRPEMLADLKRTPWLLFEAAALGRNSIEMIAYLLDIGFNISAVDENGCGNPLVFALFSGNIVVFQYLVQLGVSIYQYANGDIVQYLPYLRYNDVQVWKKYLKPVLFSPIHAAVLRGDHYAVKYLLEKGVDPNHYGSALPIQLAATLSGNDGLEMIRLLIAAGANINSTAGNQPFEAAKHYYHDRESHIPFRTTLLIAVTFGNLDMLKILHGCGAKFPVPPRCSCGHYTTASNTDAWNSNYSNDIVSNQNQMQHTKDWTAPPFYHDVTEKRCLRNYEIMWNPLLLALEDCNREMFLHLLKVASPSLKESWVTQACFSHFVQQFDWEFVTQQIQNGTFDLSCLEKHAIGIRATKERDEYWIYKLMNDYHLGNDTLMHMFFTAARQDWLFGIRSFLDKGLWPDDYGHETLDVTYGEGDTPLDCALYFLSKPTRNILLEYYLELRQNSPTHMDHFAKAHAIALRRGDFDFADRVNPHRSINDIYWHGFDAYKRRLLSYLGALSVDPRLTTSLQFTTAFGQFTTAKWLLAKGADPDISCGTRDEIFAYHSPLQCVVKESGPIELVTTLIERGADVNHRPIDIRGATALQFAAMTGNIATLKILLEAGADINAPPCKWEGRTAIEGAAELGRLDTVSLLLEAGADIKGIKNINYRRAVYRAWAHGHHVLAETIQARKKDMYGEEDCESTQSIIHSMDMETLEYVGRDLLPVPDPSEGYFDPCTTCVRGLARDG